MNHAASGNIRWQIDAGPAGLVVELAGDIDEHASLAGLARRLAGPVVLDLAGVRRINSQGVRTWIDFLRAMPAGTPLVFRRCSVPVITQINMIANFRGTADVQSFFAPYVCDACGAEQEHLVDVREQRARGAVLPPVACAACGGAMSFDDVADRYLSFLAD
jgi:anti-anti-sigma regulatory factor